MYCTESTMYELLGGLAGIAVTFHLLEKAQEAGLSLDITIIDEKEVPRAVELADVLQTDDFLAYFDAGYCGF